MMLQRKVLAKLEEWRSKPDHKPLLLKGCRQCGKTSIAIEFGRTHYRNVVHLDFFKNPELGSAFSGALDVDSILLYLGASLPDARFIPGETLLLFDEIQECPEARTSLKFFREDGRYDVLGTGSMLGVAGYGNASRSIPVGSEVMLNMYPMDFEEFLWANGISTNVIDVLRECLRSEKPVPTALHMRLRQLMLQYVAVGGMPEVVQSFVNSKQMSDVLEIQRSIVQSYRDDMIKYAETRDKARIRECFDSIPRQLSKDNKKFQYSKVTPRGTSAKYGSSLQWLQDAGIISLCHNLERLELPLDGNSVDNVFKTYTCDCGLFVSMLENGTQNSVLQGDLLTYKGAVFENLIADVFGKMGRNLYYYRKDSGLEIDFAIRWRGECVPVEVKAVSGNTKSLKTVLANPDKYHITSALKLGDYNVGRSGAILTLPLYMAFLLTDV